MTRSRLLPVAAVVAVVLVVAGLLLALTASRYSSRADAATGGAGASDDRILAIAEQDAVDFTTYDYRHLKADFRRFAARATGKLRTQYATFAPDLTARFVDAKVQAAGQVVTAGIGQRSANQATVLVAVNDTVHNKSVPNGRVVYDRLAFVLDRVGNDWLASEVHEI